MAKINYVFQNESGTNLNRYRAINVETGEDVVFDLLRGGNISIVGTPLDAEHLNPLIEAINEFASALIVEDTYVDVGSWGKKLSFYGKSGERPTYNDDNLLAYMSDVNKKIGFEMSLVTVPASRSNVTTIDITFAYYFEIELVSYDGDSNELRVLANNNAEVYRQVQNGEIFKIIGSDGGTIFINNNRSFSAQGSIGIQLVADSEEGSCEMKFMIRRYYE